MRFEVNGPQFLVSFLVTQDMVDDNQNIVSNRYTYAKDDPVNVVDPSGRQSLQQDFELACIFTFGGSVLSGISGVYLTIGAILGLLKSTEASKVYSDRRKKSRLARRKACK